MFLLLTKDLSQYSYYHVFANRSPENFVSRDFTVKDADHERIRVKREMIIHKTVEC